MEDGLYSEFSLMVKTSQVFRNYPEYQKLEPVAYLHILISSAVQNQATLRCWWCLVLQKRTKVKEVHLQNAVRQHCAFRAREGVSSAERQA